MSRMQVLLRDRNVLAGLFFLLVAAMFGYASLELPLGTALRMGPGYFPLLLSGVLAVFGLVTLLGGIRRVAPEHTIDPIAWSRMIIVCGSAAFFALCLEGLGLPLATFGTVLIAASASRRFRMLEAVVLAAGFAAASWVTFSVLLGLPFRLLGSWFALLWGAK